MRALVLLTSLLLVACGSPFNCPTSTPADGSSCSNRGFACETGGGAHERCSTLSTCTNADSSTWSNATDKLCTPTNDASCAPTFNATAVAGDCTTKGLSCDYAEGRCSCAPCGPSGLNWRCRGWGDDIDTTCPSDRPPMGSPCTTPGVICRYDNLCTVSLGPDMQCFAERWQPVTGGAGTCAPPTCGIN